MDKKTKYLNNIRYIHARLKGQILICKKCKSKINISGCKCK